MTRHLKRRNTCRLCDGNDLELVVPITPTPVADAYVTEEEKDVPQPSFPLDMYQCLSCGHVQLLDIVDPSVLFSHYSYFSGNSGGLVKHFEAYADSVIRKNELAPGSFVIDIGSNDGTFLKFFKERGMRVLGIDPAENIAKVANAAGIETLPRFFDAALVDEILESHGPADVVAANNVFAHTDDMGGMADCVRKALAPSGVFVFEVSYLLDVIDKMLLGTIFHEHVCYHSVTPLEAFLRRHDLELIDIERVTIQGGSLICTAQPVGGGRPVASSVGDLKQLEVERKLHEPETLRAFSAKLEAVKADVAKLLRDLHGEGRAFAGFGAARGGTLLMYHFEFGDLLEFIVDDSPDKQNLYSPGYHIPVLPTSALYERNPDYVFILAWVHSKPIVRSHLEYLEQGGKFIICFPEILVVDQENQPF